MAEALAPAREARLGLRSRRESATPRDLHLDVIRLAAMAMVVALHVSAPLALRFDAVSPGAWWTANLVESLTRPAVPLFIMVSGLLLLAPERPQAIGTFLRHRGLRVLVPFLIWAAVYLLWRRYYHGEALTVPAAVLEVVSGPVYGHFWFIYVLLGLYLAAPILQVFVRHASPVQLWWFLALWFSGSSLLPLLEHLTGVQVGIGWTVTTGYVGYFVLGHALRDWRLAGRQWTAAAGGVLLLVAFTGAATYVATAAAGSLTEVFYGNLSPNVILLSAVMFLIARSLPLNPQIARGPAGNVLHTLSGAIFGIYLVHPMFQELLHGGQVGVSLDGLSFHPALAIPLTTLAVFGSSLLLVWCLEKLPGGRFMVG